MAKSELEKLADMVAMVRSNKLLKEEDVADIVAKAEETKDYKALYRAYIRRLGKAEAEREFARLSAMTEAERVAEVKRLRRKALDKASRLREEGEHDEARRWEAKARIVDWDAKMGGDYYTRSLCVDGYNLDEESPLGPMRFSNQIYEDEGGDYKPKLCGALNTLSVKIASSDVGFPIHVYGTIIARDSIDRRCLYLFRRTIDRPQLINSEDESLILTGPKRGLVLFKDDYVEIDLKIKDQGHGRELSKGYLVIRGTGRLLEECHVESESLATKLSTVDVMYAFVKHAVEATIAIEVVKGDFYGEITAFSTSIKNSLVLYDSKLTGTMSGNGKGVIQLMRPVVCVSLMDMLYIVVRTGDGESERMIEFTPRVNGGDEDEIFVGGIKMHVKVTWSTMDL